MNPQEVAQTVLDFIESNPDKHKQSDWAQIGECGTTGCIAGWTGMLALGWKPYKPEWMADEDIKGEPWVISSFVDEEGKRIWDNDFVPEAGKALGLDETEANELFSLIYEDAAREALRYIANGKQLDWEKIGKDYDTERLPFYDYIPYRD